MWTVFRRLKVSVVGGWIGWSVGGDRVVGGGDGHVVWRGRCVVMKCLIFFRRLQVWRHLFYSRLILIQRTFGSFVVVRIMVVVFVYVGGRGASDFGLFGGRSSEVTMCSLFLPF